MQERDVSEVIRAYQEQFAESIRHIEPGEVARAKALVARANKIVGESGLGAALAPTLLEHIKYWPSWSLRDGFQKYVGFPCSGVSGKATKEDRNNRNLIWFTYDDADYQVDFLDKGMNTWVHDDLNSYGEVRFSTQGVCVLGLDIIEDGSKEHSRWRWSQVNAFIPGPWMKHLIEIAAYIEKHDQRSFDRFFEEDALSRAANIKL